MRNMNEGLEVWPYCNSFDSLIYTQLLFTHMHERQNQHSFPDHPNAKAMEKDEV